MIAELSRLFQLQPGDIIMTGTPAGIGPGTLSLIFDHCYYYYEARSRPPSLIIIVNLCQESYFAVFAQIVFIMR